MPPTAGLAAGHFDAATAARFFQDYAVRINTQHATLAQSAAGLDGFYPTAGQAHHGLQVIFDPKETKQAEASGWHYIGLGGFFGNAGGRFGGALCHFLLFSGRSGGDRDDKRRETAKPWGWALVRGGGPQREKDLSADMGNSRRWRGANAGGTVLHNGSSAKPCCAGQKRAGFCREACGGGTWRDLWP